MYLLQRIINCLSINPSVQWKFTYLLPWKTNYPDINACMIQSMLPIRGILMKIFSFTFVVTFFSHFLFEAGRNGRENQFHKLLISCHQTWIHHSTSIAARATQKWDSVSRGKPSGKIMKRKLNFFLEIEQKSEWSNERLKTNGNKFRISHITISFKWVFYCFDFILLEYFIGSTRSSSKKKGGGCLRILRVKWISTQSET